MFCCVSIMNALAPVLQKGGRILTRAEYIDIVEKNADMVYRIAFSYFGSKADAEDVMQEVFLKLHNCDKIPETDDARKAWLIRVTTNQCHSMFRSPFRKRELHPPHPRRIRCPEQLPSKSLGPLFQLYRSDHRYLSPRPSRPQHRLR